MNNINFSNHSTKKQNIDYFVHLVRIAMSDDFISDPELELLTRIGNKLGLSDLEIDNLIETTGKSDYIPPYELFDRFEQVYEIVKMILADGVIDKNEMRLASNFASKSNFTDNEIPNLLLMLINGIKQGKDEEDLFEQYKKERKS